MKGHVPTPSHIADEMVAELFKDHPPGQGDRILYPGTGDGPFIAAVERYCNANEVVVPEGVAIELNPDLIDDTEEQNGDSPHPSLANSSG